MKLLTPYSLNWLMSICSPVDQTINVLHDLTMCGSYICPIRHKLACTGANKVWQPTFTMRQASEWVARRGYSRFEAPTQGNGAVAEWREVSRDQGPAAWVSRASEHCEQRPSARRQCYSERRATRAHPSLSTLSPHGSVLKAELFRHGTRLRKCARWYTSESRHRTPG